LRERRSLSTSLIFLIGQREMHGEKGKGKKEEGLSRKEKKKGGREREGIPLFSPFSPVKPFLLSSDRKALVRKKKKKKGEKSTR